MLILPQVIDPNDYRDDITKLVRDKTGRELTLNGDLSMSVFPWLGIRTEQLSLSQPEEIGGSMMQVETAQLQVKLLPLLSGGLEIDTVVLEQPQLRFVTLANGVNSLSGLTDSEAENEVETVEDESADPAKALALGIQGVEITNGRLEWDDRSAQQHYQLNDFNLVTGNLIGDELADINLSGTVLDLSGGNAEVPDMMLSMSGKALIDIDNLLVTVKDLVSEVTYDAYELAAELSDVNFDANTSLLNASALTIKAAGAVDTTSFDTTTILNTLSFDLDAALLKVNGLSVDAVGSLAETNFDTKTTLASMSYNLDVSQANVSELAVKGSYDNLPLSLLVPDIAANVEAQTASLSSIKFAMDDLNANISNLKVTHFIDNLAATGSLDIPGFNVASLLKKLEIDYQAADETALNNVAFSTNFDAGLEKTALDKIKLTLDQTSLVGDFSASNYMDGAIPAIKFDLSLDALDLDRYLSPEDEAAAESEGDSVGGAEALVLPMAVFKDINANGSFKADELISAGVKLTDINVLVESTPGRVAITPKASLYDGELAGSMVFTEEGDTSTLHVKNTIGVVDLAKFLTDAEITEQLTGLGTVDVDLTVVEKAGVQSNSGTIKLSAKDGSIQGVDIKSMIDTAYSTYQSFQGNASTDDAEEGTSSEDDATGFAELLGTFTLNDFNLNNEDFKINAPFFRIAGNGDIDLAAQNLDYTLNVAVVKSAGGQGGQSVDKLDGITLPIRLRGSLTAPKYSLDLKALYASLAKQKVNEKKTEFLQEELGIETDGDASTKDILKGLLMKEVLGDEEPADSLATPEATTEKTNIDSNATTSEESAEEVPLTKKEQREERKRQLLESLFN